MPIWVCVVRKAECAICFGKWEVGFMEEPPTCPHCGSENWLWGVESADTRLIRQGITRLRRRLNPGAKSKARQDQGKKQHQGFKPKIEKKGDRNLSRPDRGRS